MDPWQICWVVTLAAALPIGAWLLSAHLHTKNERDLSYGLKEFDMFFSFMFLACLLLLLLWPALAILLE
jgi:uncharacterized membrane protein